MGQNSLDHHQLFLEIDTRDEPVFVSGDVENQRAGGRRVIRGRERFFDCGKMRPERGAGDSHKPLQKFTGGGVFFGESSDNGLTENFHTLDVPIFGNACQADTAYMAESRFPGPKPTCEE